MKWYRKAADQGNAKAQLNLGFMYANGKGVAEDDAEAVKWYRKAADQGDADAQLNLGVIYDNGKGVAEDDAEAKKWYRKAAGQGLAVARYHLKRLEAKITAVSTEGAERERQTAESRRNEKQRIAAAKRAERERQTAESRRNEEQRIAATKSKQEERQAVETRRREEQRIAAAKRKEEERQAAKAQPRQEAPPTSSGSGSGFFVSKLGHVVTNEHVVRNCGSVTIGDRANKQIRADVLATDKRNDLALLKLSSMTMASADTKSLIQKLGMQVVPLSSNGLLRPDDVELGEQLMVAGYPFGDIFSDTIKVTGGMVSATKGWGDDSGQFQMDAAVQPGNSGGPIYDENGSIVGVVVAQMDRLKAVKTLGVLPENVNFGIKASTLRQFLTSNSLPTKWSQRSERMSSRDIAKIAKNQTVMVVCGP